VPRFPTILDRFRRLLAPPGRPTAALGVPAAGDDVVAELAPLLGELDAIGAQADRIEEEGLRAAQLRRENAIREAAVILEDARGRADAEHARAAAQRGDPAPQEAVAARDEAQRIGAGAQGRVAELVDEVIACVRNSGR